MNILKSKIRKGIHLLLLIALVSVIFLNSQEAKAWCDPGFAVTLTPIPANPLVGQSVTLRISGTNICDTYEIYQTQGPNVIGGSSSVYVNSSGAQTNYTTAPLPSAGSYVFEVYGYDSGTGVTQYGDNAVVTVVAPAVDFCLLYTSPSPRD